MVVIPWNCPNTSLRWMHCRFIERLQGYWTHLLDPPGAKNPSGWKSYLPAVRRRTRERKSKVSDQPRWSNGSWKTLRRGNAATTPCWISFHQLPYKHSSSSRYAEPMHYLCPSTHGEVEIQFHHGWIYGYGQKRIWVVQQRKRFWKRAYTFDTSPVKNLHSVWWMHGTKIRKINQEYEIIYDFYSTTCWSFDEYGLRDRDKRLEIIHRVLTARWSWKKPTMLISNFIEGAQIGFRWPPMVAFPTWRLSDSGIQWADTNRKSKD